MSVAATITVLVLHMLPPPTPSASPSVDPTAGSHGFAAYLIGGFFALGLLMLVGFLLRLKPRSATR
jgi:hypothetical protein